MLGGIEEAHSCAVHYLKIIVTSSRRLHHVSKVESFISNDLAMLFKFLGNHNEDLLHAVLSAGSLVSEGSGLPYKSQTKVYSIIIKCVLQEYFCVDGGSSSKWLYWCCVLLTHLWLICTESGNPRVQVLSFVLPRLPHRLKDVNGDYQQTCALTMQNMESIVQLAPIHLLPFPNDLWQKFDDVNIVEFADSSGVPYKIFQKLRRCVKEVKFILQSQNRKLPKFEPKINDDMKHNLVTQQEHKSNINQFQNNYDTSLEIFFGNDFTNDLYVKKEKMNNDEENPEIKIFIGPTKRSLMNEVKLYIEYSSFEV
ncbi:unnamed protein product [Meganyctiphanes norvegica]|uniref:Huntingtin n=1 Tax=Meganyctiphanes norvegica TaxID=48144 RepID=A0AAV2QJY8_MEGNR